MGRTTSALADKTLSINIVFTAGEDLFFYVKFRSRGPVEQFPRGRKGGYARLDPPTLTTLI